MASVTITIRQPLTYRPAQGSWLVAKKSLFNHVAVFYFGCLQAHPGLPELSAKDALTALERLTHMTKDNPHPVMPLCDGLLSICPLCFVALLFMSLLALLTPLKRSNAM